MIIRNGRRAQLISRLRKKRKRAISEVIATLLLLVMTIGIGVIIFAFASLGMNTAGLGFLNLISLGNDQLAQHLVAEQTYVGSPQTVTYLPIMITNSRATPTPVPFQQTFTFNPSSYSSYEAADLGNIRFFASFGSNSFSSPLYSWLESFSGNPVPRLATSATFWLNLQSSIGASSSITIYMVFEPATTEFDGITAGESPLISPSFAQYDNGANVFLVYNNGGSLFPLSHTGTGGSGPSITVAAPAPYTHAITGSVNGGSGSAQTWTTNGETTTALPGSYIAQVLVYLTGTAALTDLLTNVQNIGTGQFYVFRFDTRGTGGDGLGYYASGAGSTTLVATGGTSAVNTWYQMTAVNAGDQLSLYKSTSFALETPGALEDGPQAGQGYTGGGVAVTTDGASSTEYWSMIVVRAYPPAGAMPSASAGATTQLSIDSLNIYVRNVGTTVATLATLYVQDQNNLSDSFNYQISPQITIQPGDFKIVTIQFVPKHGYTYAFTLISTNGDRLTTYAKA